MGFYYLLALSPASLSHPVAASHPGNRRAIAYGKDLGLAPPLPLAGEADAPRGDAKHRPERGG